MITERLKKQQHQLQIHKDYLKKGLIQYCIISGIILGASAFIAIKYSKSRRFFRILLNTLIITVPRLFIKNSERTHIIPLILFQVLGTVGLNLLTDKIKKN